MNVVPSLITEEERTILCTRQDALDAYNRLPNHAGQVYFQMMVPESVKQSLSDRFGLNLSGIERLPFRWIRGDTAAHVDRGQSDFEKTYLVYLTDGDGEFHIGDESYPIEAGTGFSFSEGTRHEVTGTNGTTRLLLGPMSEQGFAVGGGAIIGDGATDTVYISQDGNSYYYRINDGDPIDLFFPIGIQNTNPAESVLKVFFTTDLTFSSEEGNPGVNGYFDMASDSIQIGNTTLNANGTKTTITLDGVINYGGFIRNSGSSNILLYNLNVVATNGSSLSGGSGWVGGYSYGSDGTNNYIIGCSSNGPIPNNGGGIVGGEAATNSFVDSVDLTIVGCTSSGAIASDAGGIAGEYCGQSGGSTVTILKCSSSGTIGQNGGGIVGPIAGQGGASCVVRKCYSTGTIGTNAGGIFGRYAGDAGQAIAEYCYSRGTIGTDAGAIFGRDAAPDGTTIATGCYGIGSGGEEGIYGTSASEGASSTSCYIANVSWSDSAAITAGLDLTIYISTGINTPYEIRAIGPSPYSLTTIGDEDMTLTFSGTVAAGSSSIAAVLAGLSSFSILEIDGESPAEIPTITINGTTGVISTTSETPAGTYNIIVRAVTNPYSITTFVLTVTEGPSPSPSTPNAVPIGFKRLDYSRFENLVAGNRLVQERLSNQNIRFLSYSDYMKYRIARATISTK